MSTNTASDVAPVSAPAPKKARASRRLQVVPPPALAPKAPRALRAPKAPPPPGFMSDVRAAFTRPRALELCIGTAFAGFVPVAVFETAHVALPKVLALAEQNQSFYWLFAGLIVIILGGLLYSAPTVYAVGLEAFNSKKGKALGFTVLIEGVMTLVPIAWLQVTALVLLIAINAVGTATGLARGKQPAEPQF